MNGIFSFIPEFSVKLLFVPNQKIVCRFFTQNYFILIRKIMNLDRFCSQSLICIFCTSSKLNQIFLWYLFFTQLIFFPFISSFLLLPNIAFGNVFTLQRNYVNCTEFKWIKKMLTKIGFVLVFALPLSMELYSQKRIAYRVYSNMENNLPNVLRILAHDHSWSYAPH